MRPIDADALIEKCGGWYVDECTESGFIGTLENLLATEPTIQSQSTTGQLNDGVQSTVQSTDLIDRQQTLDALIGAVKKVGILDADDIKAVFDMLPTIQPVATDTNVGDTISRQWLLECINDGWIKFDTDKDANRFIHLVRDIAPTIQPEKRTEKRTETHACDLISRQAAIDAVEKNACNTQRIMDAVNNLPPTQPEPQWIPVSERLPSKEEYKEWIDNNLDGIGYLYPCLVTRYSSINPDRTKNNPYVAKHYFDGEDFLNAGEEVCSEYIIAWMPLPEAYKPSK